MFLFKWSLLKGPRGKGCLFHARRMVYGTAHCCVPCCKCINMKQLAGDAAVGLVSPSHPPPSPEGSSPSSFLYSFHFLLMESGSHLGVRSWGLDVAAAFFRGRWMWLTLFWWLTDRCGACVCVCVCTHTYIKISVCMCMYVNTHTFLVVLPVPGACC